jgi:hypothetical protein
MRFKSVNRPAVAAPMPVQGINNQPCQVVQGTPPSAVPGMTRSNYPQTTPQPSCVSSSSGTISSSQTSSSSSMGYIVLGLFGVIFAVSLVIKFKTHSGYISFQGRLLALAIALANAYTLSTDYPKFTDLDCATATKPSEDCPSMIGMMASAATAVFAILLNVPFLVVSGKIESSLYSKYSLYQQAYLTFGVAGACTGAIQMLGGSIIYKILVGAGGIPGACFLLGYFKNEDGALNRLAESVMGAVADVGKAASELLGSGFDAIGMGATDRKKVTAQNVFLHARVVKNTAKPDEEKDKKKSKKVKAPKKPAKGSDDEDDEDDDIEEGKDADKEKKDDEPEISLGGEIIGFQTESASSGKKPAAGVLYAVVLWDDKTSGEFSIGADDKFDLLLENDADEAGMYDSLMNVFGFGSSAAPGDEDGLKKQQIELFLTSSASEGGSSLILETAVFDSYAVLQTTVDAKTKTGLKGAIRYRDGGENVSAMVIELQKIPSDVQFLIVLCRKRKDKESLEIPNKLLSELQLTVKSFGQMASGIIPTDYKKSLMEHGSAEGLVVTALCRFTNKSGETEWLALQKFSHFESVKKLSKLSDSLSPALTKVQEKLSKDKKFVKEQVNVADVLRELELESLAQQKAKEGISKQVDEIAAKLEANLRKAGRPEKVAKAVAKQQATLQFQKVQGAQYNAVLKKKLQEFLRAGKPGPIAVAMAKKEAQNFIAFGGKSDVFHEQARKELEAEEAAIKQKAEEEYNNSYAGQAANLFGVSGGSSDTKKKKKKK